jgi:hypothetical protein
MNLDFYFLMKNVLSFASVRCGILMMRVNKEYLKEIDQMKISVLNSSKQLHGIKGLRGKDLKKYFYSNWV